MGIDYRIVNGYVYISGNPVTDPAKIAERAGLFQKRAGYYYENWAELYGKWRVKMESLIAELAELRYRTCRSTSRTRWRSARIATRRFSSCLRLTAAACGCAI